MLESILINFKDIKSVAKAIKEGITTLELMNNFIVEAELTDDGLIISPEIWEADNGNASVSGEFESGYEAAKSYVEDGDWGKIEKTDWITVSVWRNAIDSNGEIVQVDRENHTISLEPEEPECTEDEHNWESPYKILGGLKENPGVFGHGGGIITTSVCLNCGCGRHIDTWAQNMSNGEQGLESVEYIEEEYIDQIKTEMEEVS